ncbi:MAG TPA: SPFH domain-containing protein [Candidatus Pullichristensenella excrementipullorum]|nr:SPFH domain-containing protein [Candidatus Pullichristensenella excrementipullorum]
MAKFVIECPRCGKYVEAKTGFFARKKIDCACGYTINVRTDKMASRTCPHCGNNVVFDQSRGEDARCPVCGEAINTMAEQTKAVEFSCRQCGVRLRVSRGAERYTCPVCDFENDVAERLKAEQIRQDGLASIIKYEGDGETLVWKHPIEDFNLGSQLIVHESQEAIFFRDGQALDAFGAGRYTLETQQLPMLEKLYKLPTDTEGTFHSEVYFINMATQMGVKWGTDSKVRLFDPTSGLHVELGASGEFNIRVVNARKLLLRVVGTTANLRQEDLLGGGRGFFRAMVMTQVKSYLAAAIRENNISVLEIDERLMELSEALRDRINPRLAEYGLEMAEFFVSRVVTPDDDPNFRRMKEQFAEQYLGVRQEEIRRREAEAAARRKAVEAQTAAQMKIIGAQGEAEALKIQKQAEAEAYRMQAAAEAEEMRMKGYTYQQETARKVGMEAMQHGITGNGGGVAGGLGDLAGLGVTLGAMGSVVGMTKDALNPVMDAAAQMGRAVGGAIAPDGWDCPDCGQKGIASNFCPNCGRKRPAPDMGWTCPDCGQKGIASNFCPNCGHKRPAPDAGWTCPDCGQKGIVSNFCPNCGKKREG